MPNPYNGLYDLHPADPKRYPLGYYELSSQCPSSRWHLRSDSVYHSVWTGGGSVNYLIRVFFTDRTRLKNGRYRTGSSLVTVTDTEG